MLMCLGLSDKKIKILAPKRGDWILFYINKFIRKIPPLEGRPGI